MNAGIWFWLIIFIAAIGGCWGFYPPDRRPYAPFGFLLWLAVVVLGWTTYGGPIK